MHHLKFISSNYILSVRYIGRLSHQFNIVSLDGDFVLLSGLHALDAFAHRHASHVLLTQEVTDLNGLAIVLQLKYIA